jgi:hypothetical protein
MTQLLRTPDLNAQRAAMQKLAFLVGKWSGEARVLRGPDEWLELDQTEEAQYKLDGLILTIEGVGRSEPDGATILQAFGIISYDDESKTYRMRAFNDGRFLETEVKLSAEKHLTWGFAMGNIKTFSIMRITEAGLWTEMHSITVDSLPEKRLMQVEVRRRVEPGRAGAE